MVGDKFDNPNSMEVMRDIQKLLKTQDRCHYAFETESMRKRNEQRFKLKKEASNLVFKAVNHELDPRNMSPNNQTHKVAAKLMADGLILPPDALTKN